MFGYQRKLYNGRFCDEERDIKQIAYEDGLQLKDLEEELSL